MPYLRAAQLQLRQYARQLFCLGVKFAECVLFVSLNVEVAEGEDNVRRFTALNIVLALGDLTDHCSRG